jgi:methylated-DNA-[protein]-cysteine S-methyltransferase
MSNKADQEKVITDTPIGRLAIILRSSKLVGLQLDCDLALSATYSNEASLVINQINEYFVQSKFSFTLDAEGSGTPYQKNVWQALQKIPFGTVVTYGQLAKQLESSARAIGSACRRNPIPLIVPCHRVVAAKDIGGFSGQKQGKLLDIKRLLLRHEGLSY